MNLFNLLIVVIFLVLKGIFLPILNKTWKSKNLMQLTSGNFYEYEEDLDKWLLKKEYEQVKTYCNGDGICTDTMLSGFWSAGIGGSDQLSFRN